MAISEIQLTANRKNAKKGGVKTIAGKLVSRYNARKHGLLSKEVLLPTEDTKDLAQLEVGIVATLKPQDDFQRSLVDIIVSCLWRKLRALRHERQCIESEEHRYFGRTSLAVPSDVIMRYEMALDRQMYRALIGLQEMQRLNKSEIQVEETQVD